MNTRASEGRCFAAPVAVTDPHATADPSRDIVAAPQCGKRRRQTGSKRDLIAASTILEAISEVLASFQWSPTAIQARQNAVTSPEATPTDVTAAVHGRRDTTSGRADALHGKTGAATAMQIAVTASRDAVTNCTSTTAKLRDAANARRAAVTTLRDAVTDRRATTASLAIEDYPHEADEKPVQPELHRGLIQTIRRAGAGSELRDTRTAVRRASYR